MKTYKSINGTFRFLIYQQLIKQSIKGDMRYRKVKPTHKYHPQFIYWNQNRIVKDALAKGWRMVVQVNEF